MTVDSAGKRHAYRVFAWGGAAAVLVASIVPPPAPVAAAPLGFDKLVHAASYGVLMFCFGRAYARPSWLRAATLLTCYGVLIELLQQFSPARCASAADALANLIGISIMLGMLYRGERESPRTPPV
ncbi:MAG: VanZ family protein [Gammaproteobacteria bacterium]|nr:VanZ family protein [Gammaproteobacteria bacterium]